MLSGGEGENGARVLAMRLTRLSLMWMTPIDLASDDGKIGVDHAQLVMGPKEEERNGEAESMGNDCARILSMAYTLCGRLNCRLKF